MCRFRFASVALVAATLAVAGPAAANVGVTSATAGDPLGQPPAQQERVLRVGVDVQANERVTTKADDRAHLVFLDGTALTVGPNSTIVIDKYVFDPNSKTGEIVLGASKGVFRLVGGSISKSGEIKVTTPSATIGIRGGIATIVVSDTGATTATFLYGKSMTVSGQGQTQTAIRSGSQIQIESGRPPSAPTIVPPRGEVASAILEKPATIVAVAPVTPVVAVAARPVLTTVVPVVQQIALAPAIAPVTPITAIEIDKALDTSQISIVNSKVSVATLIDHDGSQKGEGQEHGQQRQGGKPGQGAGLAPTASVPKIMTVLKLTTVANRAVVQQQALRAQVITAPVQTGRK